MSDPNVIRFYSVSDERGHRLDCGAQNGRLVSRAVHQRKTAVRYVSWELDWRLFDSQIDDGGNPKFKNAGDISGVECITDPELLRDDFSH